MEVFTENDTVHIQELIELIPLFENRGFDPVDRTKLLDPFYISYSEDANKFIKRVISDYWLEFGYNKGYALEFIKNQSLIKTASLDDIKQIFSFLQRGERFCAGVFWDAFETGVILTCLYRLKQLIED